MQWVIVYVPGGDIYQALEPPEKSTLSRRLLHRSIKTLLTCAQLYWWIKS